MATLVAEPDPSLAGLADVRVLPEPITQEKAQPRLARSIGIVVTGDNHLSQVLPRLSPPRRAERRQRVRAAFGTAITYAIEHGARLVVIAGDLFDTPAPSNQDRVYVAAALARLRRMGIACVAIGGNHDTPRMLTENGGEAPLRVYAALDALHYCDESATLRPRLLELDDLRLAVAGLTTNPVAAPGSDPLAGVALEDAGVLAGAHIGLLVLHAAIEGLSQPNEGERMVPRASIEALPPAFRVVVAGHIHRYGRQRVGQRDVIVCGATERMEFGTQAGQAGFAWIELSHEGVVRAEHVRVAEQPRADLVISTARLWPGTASALGPQLADAMPDGAPAAPPADVREPPATLLALAGTLPAHKDATSAPEPLTIARMELSEVCTPDTQVRVRLSGPLTRDQYHHLALRELLLYGQQHAFSFDLDTSALLLRDPLDHGPGAGAGAGPISPAAEVERVVVEWHAGTDTPAIATDASDVRAAADLLLARLRGVAEGEDGV